MASELGARMTAMEPPPERRRTAILAALNMIGPSGRDNREIIELFPALGV